MNLYPVASSQGECGTGPFAWASSARASSAACSCPRPVSRRACTWWGLRNWTRKRPDRPASGRGGPRRRWRSETSTAAIEDGAATGKDRDHRRRPPAHRSPAGRDRGDHRGAGGRGAARLAGAGDRQTRGHGERRGRRPAGTGPRAEGRAGGAGVFHGLWRPARAHRGADRLGARRGPGGGLRRQGHALPARVPLFHAGDRLGPLRFFGGARGLRRLQRQDVQLFPGRDEVGHRDVRRGQRQRAGSPALRPAVPARGRGRSACKSSSPATRAGSSNTPARSRWWPARTATGRRCSAISAGGCTWCSARPRTT